jgi:hypothetical protein
MKNKNEFLHVWEVFFIEEKIVSEFSINKVWKWLFQTMRTLVVITFHGVLKLNLELLFFRENFGFVKFLRIFQEFMKLS